MSVNVSITYLKMSFQSVDARSWSVVQKKMGMDARKVPSAGEASGSRHQRFFNQSFPI